jgi:hypothetical protein
MPMKEDSARGDHRGASAGKTNAQQHDDQRSGDQSGDQSGNQSGDQKKGTGAGKEATAGIPRKGAVGDVGHPDARPVNHPATDKGSGYGGNKGGPKTSSDQR